MAIFHSLLFVCPDDRHVFWNEGLAVNDNNSIALAKFMLNIRGIVRLEDCW